VRFLIIWAGGWIIVGLTLTGTSWLMNRFAVNLDLKHPPLRRVIVIWWLALIPLTLATALIVASTT
jgi:hypothetical protein